MELVRHFKKLLIFLAIVMLTIALLSIFQEGYRYYMYADSETNPRSGVIKPVYVFQIGFSKCGTQSLTDFFNYNGVPSVHHDGGHLAISMFENYKKGDPLLSSVYQGYYGFFDMERMYDYPPLSVPMTLFKELDKQYHGSKFILNVRNKQAWLKSKAYHPAYHQNMRWLQLHSKFYNITEEEVIAKWSQEWDDHIQAVKEYFKDRPNDLLVFDIEKDSPKKLCAFFKDYFNLDPKYYKHVNKSVDREHERIINY